MSQEKIRVMVVEDHAMMRFGIVAMIRNTSDIVVAGEASSGEEAIEQFANVCPDVTIMDVRLPGMNGADAICLLRSRYPDARFLVITAHDDNDVIHQVLEAGAASYLLKGMTRAVLIDALRRVHAGQQFLPLPCRARSSCEERSSKM
jgi:DNA-binding NarL/FixJ family response regulator